MKQDIFHILLFTRYPVPGEVKTRLITALGTQQAARLHRRLTEHVIDIARKARANMVGHNVRITVYCAGAPLKSFRSWLGRDLSYGRQPSGDLGFKMNQAITKALEKGAHSAILLGTDLPGLSEDLIARSHAQLQTKDVVLGPAKDGGYFLVGLKKPYPELFANIPWGTDSVLDKTIDASNSLGLKTSLVDELQDVDRPKDLDQIRNNDSLMDAVSDHQLLSVIIPTLNEANNIGSTIGRVMEASNVEVIVSDGGSVDQTRSIALSMGAQVLTIPDGRAAQLNEGAQSASGRRLLFLHADTLLPEGYDKLINKTLDDPSIAAGAFKFSTDATRWSMRLAEFMTNIRSKYLNTPYGDQGLFVEARIFQESGGFANMPIMEDYELVRRLARRGKITTLSNPIQTSARRWNRLGLIRTTIINQIMIAGFHLGVPVHSLEKIYRNKKRLCGKPAQSKEESSP